MIGDGIPKIQVARSGYDVRTADPRYLTIDSTRNHSKVLMDGSGSVELNSGNSYDASVQIAHNLGYQPAFFALCREVGVTNFKPMTFFNWEGGDGVNYFDRIVIGKVTRFDSNNIYLQFYESPDFMATTPYEDRTIEYCYKLFTDPEEGAWYE